MVIIHMEHETCRATEFKSSLLILNLVRELAPLRLIESAQEHPQCVLARKFASAKGAP